MTFTSIDFFIFLFLLFTTLIFLKNNNLKKLILLLSGFIFYGYWDYRFLSLIIFATFWNYFVGYKMSNTELPIKKYYLIIGIFINLGILCFFKYFNFFISSSNVLLKKFGFELGTMNIILPIGISFFTFEAISYLADIYKGKITGNIKLFDFALFMSFFPRMISGPIIRPADFLPQIDKDIKIVWDNVRIGMQIFIAGLIKKLIIADRLSKFVDPVFQNPHLYNSNSVWLAVIAYSIQIFCDFSGYTDMAIGTAKCLGFYLPPNFKMPYISKNITEFWKRWHISLSSWLKDYLYIPLGGNRKGTIRTYVNLMITMLLGGLWHGARWNFIVWGGMHGLALCIHKLYAIKTKNFQLRTGKIYNIVSLIITYIFVCFCWVFFRSKDFTTSFIIVKKLQFIDFNGTAWYYTPLAIIIPLVILAHVIGKRLNEKYIILPTNKFIGIFTIIFVLIGILIFMPQDNSPFVYFQF